MLAMNSLRCTIAAGPAAGPRPAPAGGWFLCPAVGRPSIISSRAAQPKPKRAQALPADAATSTTETAEAGCGRKKLFDDLGGAEGMKLAVDTFYDKVLADPELLPFFESLDMQEQKMKQVKFMSFVFGGADQYKGRSMYDAHAHLVKGHGLDHRHFDKIKQYLGETLQEMGVKQDVIQHAAGVVESTRDEFDFPNNCAPN
ncbi:hypothetical protein COHA_000231 [Chlorella ohadii]|uniref:Group 1 truncated hemoglobin n=1 Tax=Chlorella ohadii TaxID=2649997 RepID=A0AAD5E017_9CHLO|nr:hypothetical protein COHA_000231 [Chlorella ohadii]